MWSPPPLRPSDRAGLVESDPTTRCPAWVLILAHVFLKPVALPTELPGAPFSLNSFLCHQQLQFSTDVPRSSPLYLKYCIFTCHSLNKKSIQVNISIAQCKKRVCPPSQRWRYPILALNRRFRGSSAILSYLHNLKNGGFASL